MFRYVKVTSDGVTIVDNKTELTGPICSGMVIRVYYCYKTELTCYQRWNYMFRYVKITSDRVTIVDNKTELTGLVINDGPICSGM